MNSAQANVPPDFNSSPSSTLGVTPARQIRDSQIQRALNAMKVDAWSWGGTPEERLFAVQMALNTAASHQSASDGTRRTDAQLSDSDCQKFHRTLVESNSRVPPDYQWIFDQFWSAGPILLDLAGLRDVTARYLTEIRPAIEQFIDGRANLKTWVPCEAQHGNFIESLEIPLLNGGPDMLLHDLGSFATDRIQHIFPNSDRHGVVLNTSGSGKTRLAFEGLCQHWGLYFTAEVDAQRHGSSDLGESIIQIETDKDFTADLPWSSPTEFEDCHDKNMTIAQTRFRAVLYARLEILQLFCRVARTKWASSPNLPDHLKKAWLMLQIKSPEIFHSLGLGSRDIFAELSSKVTGTAADLINLNRNLLTSISTILGSNSGNIFCVIDEAQAVATKCSSAFVSRKVTVVEGKPLVPDCNNSRGILRELVASWVKPKGMWIVISGTGMSREVVETAMASAVAKGNGYVTVSDVGVFNGTTTAQRDYIRRLIPPELRNTVQAKRTYQLADKWLRGRFRFTAAYVRELLISDFQQPELLLQQFVKACTDPLGSTPSLADSNRGFVPTGGKILDSGQEDARTIRMGVLFNFERLRASDPVFFDEIKNLVNEQLMRTTASRPATELNSTQKFDAVTWGFARLVTDQYCGKSKVDVSQQTIRVFLDEPLVILAIARWMDTHDVSMFSTIRYKADRATHESTNGGRNSLEEYVVSYLSIILDGRTPLDKIFLFQGKRPAWAKKKAFLVSLYNAHIPQYWAEDGVKGELESGRVSLNARPSTALGFKAKKVNETEDWLKHRIDAPFLFPDEPFGPDIVFILELGDKLGDADNRRIWVAVQSKFSRKKIDRGKVLGPALRTVTPSEFYLVKNTQQSGQRSARSIMTREEAQKLNDRIVPIFRELPDRQMSSAGTCSLLRVIASHPAPVDAARGKRKGKYAQLEFYEDAEGHPLAEIDVDLMKQTMDAHKAAKIGFSDTEQKTGSSKRIQILDIPFQAKKRRTRRSEEEDIDADNATTPPETPMEVDDPDDDPDVEMEEREMTEDEDG